MGYAHDQRAKVRAQSLRDAGADSTNGRESRDPEGESSPQSRHTTRIVNTRIVRREETQIKASFESDTRM